MENKELYIIDNAIDDIVFEDNKFVVDTDSKAEWALKKIREEKAEMDRMTKTCHDAIKHYHKIIENAYEDYKRRVSYFEMQLENYFEMVDKRKTKTQEIYKLPSGVLKRKFPLPRYDIDDKKLLEWLKDRGLTDFIKTEEKPKWGDLKKTLSTAGDKMVDENGEIVDGVKVVDRPSFFEINVE